MDCKVHGVTKSRTRLATFTSLHFTFKRYPDFDLNLTTLVKASGISYLEYYISFLFDLTDSTSTLLFFFHTLLFLLLYFWGFFWPCHVRLLEPVP